MLHIREHGVGDYESLHDMDATDVGVLDDTDHECLREIGEYLAGTEAWERFAVWLLHKHFEPRAGEVFVEHSVPGEGRTETAPTLRTSFAQSGLHASGLRFEDVETGVGLVGLEFAELAEFGDVAPLNDGDGTVLASIADHLRAHGKLDRFGVKVIRNPLALSDGELLLETCDTATRIQHCEIAPRDSLPTDVSIIETTWRWRVTEAAARPVVMQECTAGCTPVGQGHDLAHQHTENAEGVVRPVVMQECTAGCTPVGEGHDLAHRHSQTDNQDDPIN
jgi:hypothetical protein